MLRGQSGAASRQSLGSKIINRSHNVLRLRGELYKARRDEKRESRDRNEKREKPEDRGEREKEDREIEHSYCLNFIAALFYIVINIKYLLPVFDFI